MKAREEDKGEEKEERKKGLEGERKSNSRDREG